MSPCPCENCNPEPIDPSSVRERLYVLGRYCCEAMQTLEVANAERQRLVKMLSPASANGQRQGAL